MSILELITQMGWPAAVAFIGVSWAIAVPIIIRRSLVRSERIAELHLQRAIQLEQFKKGALTYTEEHAG